MNPTKPSTPQSVPASKAAVRTPVPTKSKKDLDLDLKKFLPKIKKSFQKITVHLAFIAIILVLLVYMFVVWQIRGLVTAEPSAEDESVGLASTNISKIDQKAIEQIQSLEQNSPKIRALFDDARNNPFHE